MPLHAVPLPEMPFPSCQPDGLLFILQDPTQVPFLRTLPILSRLDQIALFLTHTSIPLEQHVLWQ